MVSINTEAGYRFWAAGIHGDGPFGFPLVRGADPFEVGRDWVRTDECWYVNPRSAWCQFLVVSLW